MECRQGCSNLACGYVIIIATKPCNNSYKEARIVWHGGMQNEDQLHNFSK
jgi:hypothetical protein